MSRRSPVACRAPAHRWLLVGIAVSLVVRIGPAATPASSTELSAETVVDLDRVTVDVPDPFEPTKPTAPRSHQPEVRRDRRGPGQHRALRQPWENTPIANHGR